MEDFETLSISDSCEFDQALSCPQTVKARALPKTSQSGLDEKLLSIISHNLYKDSEYLQRIMIRSKLKASYKDLKTRYLISDSANFNLKDQLIELINSKKPCTQCEVLEADITNTKKALDDAILLSHTLLKECKSFLNI